MGITVIIVPSVAVTFWVNEWVSLKPQLWCNGCVLASSVVDRGFEPWSGQSTDSICCFSARHAALRKNWTIWLAQNQDNMSQWCYMSIRGLLFQWASTINNPTKRVVLVKSGPHHHLIENNLCSPWYSCKFAELVFNNNRSLTVLLKSLTPLDGQ